MGGRLKFVAFIENEFLPDAEKQLRPSTVNTYRWMLKRFAQGLNNYEVAKIRTVDLQKFIEVVAVANPELKHATYVRLKSLLSSVFAHAIRTGVRDDNPARAVRVPKGRRGTEPAAVTAAELAATLAVLSGPARVAVAIAGYAGLRAGEIRGLRWSDWDETAGLLYVRRSIWRTYEGETKTAASRSSVPVIEKLATELANEKQCCIGLPSAYARIVRRDLAMLTQRVIRPVLAEAGVEWRGWHSFRRGLGTNLHQLGVQDKVIQQVLRHSNVAVTQKSYIRTSSVDAVEAMKKLGRMM